MAVEFNKNENFVLDWTMLDSDTSEVLSYKVYGNSRFVTLLHIANEVVNPFKDYPLDVNSFDNHLEEEYPALSVFLVDHVGGFEVGDTIVSSSGRNGIILAWNPTLKKLTVEDEGASPVNADWKLDAVTAGNGSTGNTGRVVYVSKFALHHFIDDDGNSLNPYNKPASQTQLDGYIEAPFKNDGVVTNFDYEMVLNLEKHNIKIIRLEHVEVFDATA